LHHLQGVKAEVQLAVHKDDVALAIKGDASLTALKDLSWE
jgi:hypothetical protein